MVARYLIPEINGHIAKLRRSRDFVATNRGVFDRAKEAIMAKVMENRAAVASPGQAQRLGHRLEQQRDQFTKVRDAASDVAAHRLLTSCAD